MPFELLNPAGLEKPVGYAHVAKITSGKLLYVTGQAPFDASGAVVGKGDFVAQFRQVMHNLKLAVIKSNKGGRTQIPANAVPVSWIEPLGKLDGFNILNGWFCRVECWHRACVS